MLGCAPAEADGRRRDRHTERQETSSVNRHVTETCLPVPDVPKHEDGQQEGAPDQTQAARKGQRTGSDAGGLIASAFSILEQLMRAT